MTIKVIMLTVGLLTVPYYCVCLQRYVCVLTSYKATHSDDKWRDSRTEAGPSPTPPPDYSQRRVLQNGHVQGHR